MRASIVLDMVLAGKIDELIKKLRDEIYVNSLKRKPNGKKRYSAMKKYFTLSDSVRDICQKPCEVEFEGRDYISFTDSFSIILTTEGVGEMELFDNTDNRYPDPHRLIRIEGKPRKVDLNKVIAEAKSRGYKLKKYEYFANRSLLHYDGAFFRIPLIDAAYSIIADDGEVDIYHGNDYRKPLVIKNNIGMAVIMPINRPYDEDKEMDESKIIIEVDLDGNIIRNEEELNGGTELSKEM